MVDTTTGGRASGIVLILIGAVVVYFVFFADGDDERDEPAFKDEDMALTQASASCLTIHRVITEPDELNLRPLEAFANAVEGLERAAELDRGWRPLAGQAATTLRMLRTDHREKGDAVDLLLASCAEPVIEFEERFPAGGL